ncbi:alpha-ketoglutarate-dependent dioxygenase AlkB [soil metagenome]
MPVASHTQSPTRSGPAAAGLKGFRLLPGRFDAEAQAALLREALAAAERAPFYDPVTPWGKPMSVRNTCLGALGWTTGPGGYRYSPLHPVTGEPWPPIPSMLLDLWTELAPNAPPPDSCLVNLYVGAAKMGLHQDRDEAELQAPVVSVSLGDTAIFRIGGLRRTDPTTSVRLTSGDVCVLGGEARMAFHGIDRVIAGSSRLVPGGGRINLTLRRAGPLSESLSRP